VGRASSWKCSCGDDLQNCDFWGNILNHLKQKGYTEIGNTKILKKTNFIRTHIKIENVKENNDIVNLINDIYALLFNLYNCDIIVDSSKDESHLLALYNNVDFNLKVIYLKRDIRAVT